MRLFIHDPTAIEFNASAEWRTGMGIATLRAHFSVKLLANCNSRIRSAKLRVSEITLAQAAPRAHLLLLLPRLVVLPPLQHRPSARTNAMRPFAAPCHPWRRAHQRRRVDRRLGFAAPRLRRPTHAPIGASPRRSQATAYLPQRAATLAAPRATAPPPTCTHRVAPA